MQNDETCRVEWSTRQASEQCKLINHAGCLAIQLVNAGWSTCGILKHTDLRGPPCRLVNHPVANHAGQP
jgi:hypothetical protein